MAELLPQLPNVWKRAEIAACCAQVYKAIQYETRDVAVKIAHIGKADDEAHMKAFWHEIELLASLRHSNLLQFYGVINLAVSAPW